MASPRILIFGVGSLGIVFGAILDRAGADLVCICRSNYAEAKSTGLSIKSSILGDHHYRPQVVNSVTEAAALSNTPFDYVVVCTKAFLDAAQSTASAIADAVSEMHTTIVLVQNGIGVEKAYKSRYPNNTIISGIAYMPSSQLSPGVVVQTETQRLLLGIFPSEEPSSSDTERLRRFSDAVEAGGANAVLKTDIQIERWSKLIGNATWNPICALSRCRDLELLRTSPIAREFVQAAMHEVREVAAAVGYAKEVTTDVVESQMARSAARSWPGVEPSMMADMNRGSRMEVEAILGEIVRVAREKGVLVLRLETLFVLLNGLDWFLQKQRRSEL